MKGMPWFAAMLSCSLALQAHAGDFSKCSRPGGGVAYRAHACLPGETLLARLPPVPDPPTSLQAAEAARTVVTADARRSSSSRTHSSRGSARTGARHPRKTRANRNPCSSAKKARDAFQRRRGIHVTMDELSRWNHRVYDACK